MRLKTLAVLGSLPLFVLSLSTTPACSGGEDDACCPVSATCSNFSPGGARGEDGTCPPGGSDFWPTRLETKVDAKGCQYLEFSANPLSAEDNRCIAMRLGDASWRNPPDVTDASAADAADAAGDG